MIITQRRIAGVCLLVLSSFSSAWAARLPEGTDVRLQMTDRLSSATATEGQRFNLIVDEDVQVGGVVLVPRGAKAVGTVINADKRRRMGKAGELNIQINYVLVGDQRVSLRASSGREGDSKVGATVALTVLFGPIGLLKRGKDVEINPGVVLTAQVDQTTEVPSPAGAYSATSMPSTSMASGPQAGTTLSSSASANASSHPSGPAARGEFIKLGCSDNFAVLSSGGGRTIFEATCGNGKRQLLECYGNGCRALN